MPCTLWRGPQLLGDLHLRERTAEGLSGILIPVDGLDDLVGVMQTELGVFPGSPVFQSPVEPMVVPEPHSAHPRSSGNSGPVPLKRLTEEEAKGIAPELQLSIRDEAGARLIARMILLSEFRFSSGLAARAFAELPDVMADKNRVWMVVAALDGDA